jgi:hypothetical protein
MEFPCCLFSFLFPDLYALFTFFYSSNRPYYTIHTINNSVTNSSCLLPCSRLRSSFPTEKPHNPSTPGSNALRNLGVDGGNIKVHPSPVSLHITPLSSGLHGRAPIRTRRDVKGDRVFEPAPEYLNMNFPRRPRRPDGRIETCRKATFIMNIVHGL